MTNKMKGKVIRVKGAPNPNSYIIQKDGDEKTYLVHVGDIKQNEHLLYALYEQGAVTILQKGDTVEFESDSDHAIHVNKLN